MFFVFFVLFVLFFCCGDMLTVPDEGGAVVAADRWMEGGASQGYLRPQADVRDVPPLAPVCNALAQGGQLDHDLSR